MDDLSYAIFYHRGIIRWPEVERPQRDRRWMDVLTLVNNHIIMKLKLSILYHISCNAQHRHPLFIFKIYKNSMPIKDFNFSLRSIDNDNRHE